MIWWWWWRTASTASLAVVIRYAYNKSPQFAKAATNKTHHRWLVRRWNKCVKTTACRGLSSLTRTYTTPDSGLSYTYWVGTFHGRWENEMKRWWVAVASAGPCKSLAPRFRQITTPTSHHSSFTGGCSSWRPTNSVRPLKAIPPKENTK